MDTDITRNDVVNDNCESSEIPVVDKAGPHETRLEEDVTSPNVHPLHSIPILSPEVVRPYPKKILGSSSSKKGREKGKSRVFTDTPEKDRLQALYEEKIRKRQVKMKKQKAKELKTARNLLGLTETQQLKNKRRRHSQSDSNTSRNESVTLSDDDDMDFVSDLEDSDICFDVPNPKNINVADFLLIKYEKKKTVL